MNSLLLSLRSTSTPQRFKFNSRIRKSSESIAEYVAELRKLALHCDYKDALSEMLRDRLVCGVNDDRMQRRLLSETKLLIRLWNYARLWRQRREM